MPQRGRHRGAPDRPIIKRDLLDPSKSEILPASALGLGPRSGGPTAGGSAGRSGIPRRVPECTPPRDTPRSPSPSPAPDSPSTDRPPTAATKRAAPSSSSYTSSESSVAHDDKRACVEDSSPASLPSLAPSPVPVSVPVAVGTEEPEIVPTPRFRVLVGGSRPATVGPAPGTIIDTSLDTHSTSSQSQPERAASRGRPPRPTRI
ncbi:uncharacterized protein DKFZp434B061-like [Galleria mellonella]|uniref:Uncharacterized protein DKFZp434B061-like n=1 Tax=Galleria mellonella TaxID=7137 RepID=A0ABM3MHU5_GALME|nr:uncharacterized protein DKFZp434B061-like [Galleria mellonella]